MPTVGRTLVIEVDTDKLQLGLWCPKCLLPSGYEVPLITLSESGVGQLGMLRRCHDCDSPLGTP